MQRQKQLNRFAGLGDPTKPLDFTFEYEPPAKKPVESGEIELYRPTAAKAAPAPTVEFGPIEWYVSKIAKPALDPFAGLGIPSDDRPEGTFRKSRFKAAKPSSGGAETKTADYAAVSDDSGKFFEFNSPKPVTLDLPPTAPNTGWTIFVRNIGAGALTVCPNGLGLDDRVESQLVTQDQGVYITTDGTEYSTERENGAAPDSGEFAVGDRVRVKSRGNKVATLTYINRAQGRAYSLAADYPGGGSIVGVFDEIDVAAA